ncbi:MAG: cell division protein FtsK [Rhizobiales bacterium TMED249]|uniref:DNA translocase FtsK n=1 Tax=PS1 clade bacterium TaxID=2175152 RepID=A0A368E3A2_9PROT|nr:MAG: cell division protein FtsK [Rhizobiales bacterium TMED249]RCL78374.1 MAG: DNA translocase FtsK [PS1 clade bacterium]
MARMMSTLSELRGRLGSFLIFRGQEVIGIILMAASLSLTLILFSYHASDPSLNRVGNIDIENWFGAYGAVVADLLYQFAGYGAWGIIPGIAALGWRYMRHASVARPIFKFFLWVGGIILLSMAATIAPLHSDSFAPHAGGVLGEALVAPLGGWLVLLLGDTLNSLSGSITLWLWASALSVGVAGFTLALMSASWFGLFIKAIVFALVAIFSFLKSLLTNKKPETSGAGETSALAHARMFFQNLSQGANERLRGFGLILKGQNAQAEASAGIEAGPEAVKAKPASRKPIPVEKKSTPRQGRRASKEAQNNLPLEPESSFTLPPLRLLSEPRGRAPQKVSMDALESNARLLETVLQDFGIKGEIGRVRPGPVVTLYELEPAAGIRSSRVVGLADDIARAMSAISCRVATVPGHNVIGIELPNSTRETVFLREILSSEAFEKSNAKLPLTLGKDIGGEPVLSDLTKMPHLLVAGTTGSGKSVGINTMILSILYRLTPEQCRMILVDPKMLELSIYDGIPHLLAPVVTEPKKAVAALKWAVQEMENRYRKMSKIKVRNIEGYNARMTEALEKGETLTRDIQTGFDPETGEAMFETEEINLEKLPYIVVVIDEMADLMLVAGKEIEAAVQRLAQMARAAGVHLITATQRPSVDVITGTIKANFPSRIAFQVTSKIDSRTVLGDMGAEQLLGMGDMLFMEGGGRIQRVHGPFVSDNEVEGLVSFLKKQGQPVYIDAVTEDSDPIEMGSMEGDTSGDSLYDQAVAIVTRDNRASTSYVQRRLQIGYNRAASLIEKMEEEGVISPPNHAGKREVLAGKH